jgi:hypothetical protein
LIEHSVATLVGQRVFGIALGYEDLNDHDELRHDPMMEVLAGKLAWIMREARDRGDGCGNKGAIHVANRCRDKLHRVSAERHSRHDRRYAASL